MGDRYRFGEFEFDPVSGDLRPSAGEAGGGGAGRGDAAAASRLAPQPARLLELLAAGGGELVTREEIREAIWPGITVDFDASLHYCVGQVRSALGDSAADPRYVQNLPRRGYRLIPPVERIAGGATTATATPAASPATASPSGVSAASAGDDDPPLPRPRRRILLLGAALAVAIGLAGMWFLRGALAPPGTPIVAPAAAGPIRIGILPFQPPPDKAADFPPQSIAETILERMHERAGDRLAIVGPTTTSAYANGPLRPLVQEYELEWLINGRFLTGMEGPRMLGEVIRVSDGAHVWVRPFTDFRDDRAIGKEIADAALEVLGLAAPGKEAAER